MKKLFFVTGILMLSYYAIGQARDGTADLQKHVRVVQAAMIDLPYAPAVVQSALYDFLDKSTKKQQQTAKSFLLSGNTLLVKNNITNADIVFKMGVKDYLHPNETVIYVTMNSNDESVDNVGSAGNLFDMNDAKSYLNNLSVAIKPYATDLQLKLQRNDLEKAHEENASLTTQGETLEKSRMKILEDLSSVNGDRKVARLLKKQDINKQQIDANMTAKARNEKEIADQTTALDLLESMSKSE